MSVPVLASPQQGLLDVATAEDFIRGPLHDRLGKFAATPAAGDPVRWVSLADLTGDGGQLARSLHARQVAAGATGQAVARWVCSWFAGSVATAAGFTLATAGAALTIDPAEVRWRLHPGGWPDLLDPGSPTISVLPDHPWAGQPGVEVVDTDEELHRRVLTTVTLVGQPTVEVCRLLGKVGRSTLWSEIADCLGMSVCFQPELPVRSAALEPLRAVLTGPDAPWRRTPTLGVEPTAAGAAYVVQRGGCCLAYQSPEPAGGPAQDPYSVALRERFGSGGPRYCGTCSLRDRRDCLDRQVFDTEWNRGAIPPSSDH